MTSHRLLPLVTLVCGLFMTGFPASANDVEVVDARFDRSAAGSYHVSVTLRHGDTGWDHYADAWRVETEDGTVLATRELLHPHENEQPFTRGLSVVEIPAGTTVVHVGAHDKVHGWTKNRLRVELKD